MRGHEWLIEIVRDLSLFRVQARSCLQGPGAFISTFFSGQEDLVVTSHSGREMFSDHPMSHSDLKAAPRCAFLGGYGVVCLCDG
jgi:hypothetical protein